MNPFSSEQIVLSPKTINDKFMAEELSLALDLCNKNEFDKALPLLEEIVKTNPQESEAWRVLAQIHWNYSHEPDKAYDDAHDGSIQDVSIS